MIIEDSRQNPLTRVPSLCIVQLFLATNAWGLGVMSGVETVVVAARMQCQLYRLLRSFEGCDQQCLAQYGVTAAQGYTLLAFPDQSTISMNELSQAMGLANSTMTRMVDHLVAKGLVYRRPDAEDRRVVRVALTSQGRDVQRALEEARRDLLQQVLGDIQEGEWPTILYALEKLNAAIGKAMGSCCGD